MQRIKTPHSWGLKFRCLYLDKRVSRALKSWMLGCHLVLQDPGMAAASAAPVTPLLQGRLGRWMSWLEMHDEPISPWPLHDLNELLRNSGLELQEGYVIFVYIYVCVCVCIYINIHPRNHNKLNLKDLILYHIPLFENEEIESHLLMREQCEKKRINSSCFD